MEVITGAITIQTILLANNNWFHFSDIYGSQIRKVVYDNIYKILSCRKSLGYSIYTCPKCGKKEKVMHSCKSRICSSCGKAAQDKWLSKTLSELLPVQYQHLVFTLPSQLRLLFLTHRKLMMDIFFKAASLSVLNIADRQFKYIPGILAVSHSFGGTLNVNFHLHLIITCGGISQIANKWIKRTFLPHALIKTEFKILMLRLLREAHISSKFHFKNSNKKFSAYSVFNKFLDKLYLLSWYVNIGRSLEDASFAVHYVTRYTKKPVIATSRIIRFENNYVTFEYRDHSTNSYKTLTLHALAFIARFIRHIPEKYFHQMRYYGIFANRIKNQSIQLALKLLGKKLPYPSSPVLFKERFLKSFGFDRLFCIKCNCDMLFLGFYLPP